MDGFFPQERLNTCAVAALRSVLATQFGVYVREEVLRFAGDDADSPIVGTGASTLQMRRIVRAASRAVNTGPAWKLRVKRKASVSDIARELRAGRYPIASVQRSAGEHAVVLCGHRPGEVRYFDPASGRRRWRSVEAFRREWLAPDGCTWLAVVTGGTQ